jgi:hypothetical protein
MFRQGLGDCFLLTFDVGNSERHMLIDCGTLGAKTTGIKIDDVARHIFETIGDGNLDLVVATHEHQDHLSGFNNKQMKSLAGRVDHVWLAWTENPDDELAQQIAKNKRDLGQALAIVAEADPVTVVGKQVQDLLGFAGDTSLGAAKFAETVNEAMQFVRKGLGAETAYHNPGDLIEVPWLPGFRVYVLGPPRDKDILGILGDHGSDQLYGIVTGLGMAATSKRAAESHGKTKLTADESTRVDDSLPFDQRFNEHDEMGARSWYPGYFAPSDDWRRIDVDWLSSASDLALQLDSMTNNTSLALAIERIADGKVLLFPADAQQGNWLSWHAPEVKWSVKNAAGVTRDVTAADLLKRTVFYKVGHHSSHNAAARGKGLELMQEKNGIVAFIPVDRAVALTRNPKGSWQMPARPLFRRLLEKCQGRVVRSDLGWAANPTGSAAKSTEKEFIGLGTAAEWKQWGISQRRAEHVRIDDLYCEYVLN